MPQRNMIVENKISSIILIRRALEIIFLSLFLVHFMGVLIKMKFNHLFTRGVEE